jgi:hypothetical protein
VLRKPLKWHINAWNPTDGFNGYILNFSSIEREKKPKAKFWGGGGGGGGEILILNLIKYKHLFF